MRGGGEGGRVEHVSWPLAVAADVPVAVPVSAVAREGGGASERNRLAAVPEFGHLPAQRGGADGADARDRDGDPVALLGVGFAGDQPAELAIERIHLPGALVDAVLGLF